MTITQIQYINVQEMLVVTFEFFDAARGFMIMSCAARGVKKVGQHCRNLTCSISLQHLGLLSNMSPTTENELLMLMANNIRKLRDDIRSSFRLQSLVMAQPIILYLMQMGSPMMLAVLFQRCTKLLNLLENVNTEHASSGGHIHVQPLCPTRVLCKGEGIKALLKNLETVLSALLCCPYEGARWSSGINAVKD